MKLIKECLPNLLNENSSWKFRLLASWPKIIGSMFDSVILESIQEESIILLVKNSAWLQELYCLQSLLIEKINSELGGTYILFVKLKNKNFLKIKKCSEFKLKKVDVIVQTVVLSSAQVSALNNIVDLDLQVLLKNFLQRSVNQQQQKG